MRALPAKVRRTGMRQLSISLGEAQAKELERIRVDRGLRSWGQVIRMLIADAMVKRVKAVSGDR
jgi:metal-responsive CopG/Arc/MetJ family transcriptional regulator